MIGTHPALLLTQPSSFVGRSLFITSAPEPVCRLYPAYVVSILDNYSRAILASAITLAQDTNAYLSVLHAGIERHGSPGAIITDGADVFKSNRAKAVYRSLGITKEEIEKR